MTQERLNDLPEDVQVQVLRSLKLKDRLNLRMVNRSWYRASQAHEFWGEVDLTGDVPGRAQELEAFLKKYRPEKVKFTNARLDAEALAAIANVCCIEELQFRFCRMLNDTDMLSLKFHANSSIKTIMTVNNRLETRERLLTILDSMKNLRIIVSETQPKNPGEMFWGPSYRSWVCRRHDDGTLSSTFAKHQIVI